jgi:hypothetical protein
MLQGSKVPELHGGKVGLVDVVHHRVKPRGVISTLQICYGSVMEVLWGVMKCFCMEASLG